MTVVAHISNCPKHVQAMVEPIVEDMTKLTGVLYCPEANTHTVLTVKPGEQLLTPLVQCPLQLGKECPCLPPSARR